MIHHPRSLIPGILLVLLVCLGLAGCNRAAVRVPGASLAFSDTRTGFESTQRYPTRIEVVAPVDSRSAHYGEAVAQTKWDGCRTDALWADSATAIVHERLRQEVVASKLFLAPDADPKQTGALVLKTEIHAFCSQAIGVLIVRVAGIAAIKFTLEQDGKVLWQRKIERVVTDADPEYTGSQVAFLEQAMRTTMADSLRLTLRELLMALEKDVPGLLPTVKSALLESSNHSISSSRGEG